MMAMDRAVLVVRGVTGGAPVQGETGPVPTAELLARIAVAIYAAENEALETAAVLAAPLGKASGDIRWGVAESIRGIKRKPAGDES